MERREVGLYNISRWKLPAAFMAVSNGRHLHLVGPSRRVSPHNLILHAASAFLVFVFFENATGSRWRSVFVAAMFAVHPLHVESVVWVTERKDVLSVFFGLLALNAYGRYARGQHLVWLAWCWLLFVCSLLAKQTLVTLPFLLLLLDYWPFQRLTRSIGPLLLEKIPFVVVTFVFSYIAYRRRRAAGPRCPSAVFRFPTVWQMPWHRMACICGTSSGRCSLPASTHTRGTPGVRRLF